MNFFKKAEEILFTWNGSISYWEFGEVKKNMVKIAYSAFLGNKSEKKQLIIREKTTSYLGMSARYCYFDKDAVIRLRKICDDILQKMD
ncbi:MAG: hypothetical protein ACD_3C00002G0004 [uncultured bacterium (gcode 4)]|uniref:Uncharacterized protein n=1 Tax=uncultured bacterium (gcode 4) TaxID=1234023 RepID=K2G3E7_9BACT|nr:MAG: hypothetical protein ACD_3C00002G0004 [uncultured bacterium (gcode 4)]